MKSDPTAAKAIAGWVDGLETNFADRILDVDTASAKLWVSGQPSDLGRSSTRFSPQRP